MSFRNTIALIIVLLIAGGGYYLYDFYKPVPTTTTPPWFYLVDFDKIREIQINTNGRVTDIVYKDDGQGNYGWEWRDARPDEIDQGRVNGIRVLLSGPKSHRLVTEQAEDLKEYGLDKPQVQARVGLEDGMQVEIEIGDRSPDGQNYYVKGKDSDAVFMVDFTWGDELARFVAQPPTPSTPTPTITPVPTETSTPTPRPTRTPLATPTPGN